MGIRGLHTFATRVVRNGLQRVNMEEEAREYQRLRKRKPILAIDLSAFHYYVFLNVHEKLLGGRFEIFNERLHNMLSKLRSLGFEMVFFARGANEKIGRALTRREKIYQRTVRILHAIDEGLDLSRSGYFHKLDEFFGNLIHISREYGEFHAVVANNYKQEIVYQAKKRNALAIVSNDTDFLIFGGPWRFWRDLDFNENTANEYNKVKLREHLRLSESQMVLFASLVGNKFITQEMLSAFHQSLDIDSRNNVRKIYKVAAYVSNMPFEMQSDIKKLGRNIFTPENYDEGMEVLQENINFFRLIGMQNAEDFDEFLRRVADLGPRDLYILLKKDSVIIESCAYLDLSKTIFPPYFDFYKPLLCRLMGVLFWNQEKRDFSKQFYFKFEHSEPFAPEELHAVYPAGNVPSLQELLLTPYGENEDLDDRRWELLCFMISPKLKTEVLRSVPGFNLATYATLFFLVTENLIQIDEADCILISCEDRRPLPELQDQFTFEKVNKIDGRDARTAFLFLRIMRKMFVCFSAAGLKKYAGLITFDGLCFHNLRKVWNEIDKGQLDSVRQELQQFRIYAQV